MGIIATVERPIGRYIPAILSLVLLALYAMTLVSSSVTRVERELEGDVQIMFQVTSAWFPNEQVEYSWQVENIVGVYFKNNGVIGADSRLQTAFACETRNLEVELKDGNRVLTTISSVIIVLDPILWVVVLLALSNLILLWKSRQTTHQLPSAQSFIISLSLAGITACFTYPLIYTLTFYSLCS